MTGPPSPPNQTRFKLSRSALLGLAFLVFCPVVAGFSLLLIPRVPLFLARQRWQNRPFDRYRVQVEFITISKNCFYDVEITGTEVAFVHQNWCDQLGWGYIQPLDPMTVDEIFDKLAAEQSRVYCSPAGCRCGTPVVNEVVWDAELGYPTEWIRKEAELPFGVEPLPPCPVEYPFRDIGRVVKLVPLDTGTTVRR